MAIKIAVNTLTLSCYACKEFRAPPTSGVGGASARVDHVRKLLFYASFWQLTVRGLLLTCELGLQSQVSYWLGQVEK